MHRVYLRSAGTSRTGSGPIGTDEAFLESSKGPLWQQEFRYAVTDTEIGWSCRILLEPVRIRPLNAVHSARVFRFGAAEEFGSGPRACRHKICHFQRVKVDVLRVGDLGLPTEANVAHRDPMGGVDMRPNYEGSVFIEFLVGLEDIGCRSYFTATESVLRNTQEEEQVLHHADGRSGVEDRKDVETECRRELESRQNEDSTHQFAIFSKECCFVSGNTTESLQVDEIFDFMLESGPACDRVVVGEGDDVEALLVGTAQKIDRSDTWFLVVDRSGGVNV
jgi:hypothetical protein